MRGGLGGFTEWPSSAIVPAAALTLSTRPGYPGSGVHSDVALSGNGGRTFQPVGFRSRGLGVDLAATSAGILRLNLRGLPTTSGDNPYGYSLTTDGGGATWQALTLPYQPEPDADSVVRIAVSPSVPSLVFLTSRRPHDLFSASDGGLTWQRLTEYRNVIAISPTAPLTMLGVTDGELFTLELASVAA